MPSLTILIDESSEKFLAQNPSLKKFKKTSNLFKQSFSQKLFNYFLLNDEQSLPVAAVCALAENYQAEQGWWLRADPVQMEADLRHIYLLGNAHLNLSTNELDQLTAELNEFLKEDHLKLLAPQKNEWYLQVATDPNIITFDIEQVIGKEITPYLPQGKNATYWKKLLTEIQILLNSSIVNQQRKKHGEPLINSLWFWGNGKLPIIKQKPQWQKIYGNDSLTKGLALLTKIPFENFSEFDFLNKIEVDGEYLIVIGRSEHRDMTPLNLSILTKKFSKIILDFEDFTFEINHRPWWRQIKIS